MKEQDQIDINSLLNILVAEYSSPVTHFAKKGMTLASILRQMQTFDIRHIPVLEDTGVPIGIISQRDINMLMGIDDLSKVKVENVMVKNPYVVSGQEPLDEVIEEMNGNKYGCVLVVLDEAKSPLNLGILTTVDIINAFISILRGDLPHKGFAFEHWEPRPESEVTNEDVDIPPLSERE